MTNIINGKESEFELLSKMSEGDQDALKALGGLLNLGPMGLMAILCLDVENLDIHGEDLGVLYKLICCEDATTLDSVIGAWQSGQLGGATKAALHAAIDKAQRGEAHGLNVEAIVAAYTAKQVA